MADDSAWLSAGNRLADRITRLVAEGVIPQATADEIGAGLLEVLAGPAGWLRAALDRIAQLEAELAEARARADQTAEIALTVHELTGERLLGAAAGSEN